jgi:hypothetical protein
LSSGFLVCFVLILFGQACVSKCTKLFFSNRVIHKVEKERVLAKETRNTKRHNKHFLNAKKTKVNSKLPFNSRLKEFPLVSCVFFNDMNVTETSFFL